MGWTLKNADALVARLEHRDTDMPWFICSFEPGPAFKAVEQLFAEQERLIDSEAWDRVERLWARMQSEMTLIADDQPNAKIREFLLRVYGNEAWLRYEPSEFR